MVGDNFERYCKNLAETRAMNYTTDAISKWLEIFCQTKWKKILIDELKVNGKDLLSFRKEDLTVALSNGYKVEELDELMDCIRSFRMQQLCEPDALICRYLTAVSVRENSRQYKPKSEKGVARPPGDKNENLDEGAGSVQLAAREEENLHATNVNDVYPKQLSLLNEIEKESDGLFIARISQWETPNRFFITTQKWDREVKKMEKYLTECYRELPTIQLDTIFPDKPCCVLCEASETWMRGRICKTVLEHGSLPVHCVDHGYTVESPFRSIRELPVKMIKRPPLSLMCKVELGGLYGGSDEECLEKVSKYGFMVAVQITMKDYDRCTVKLFNPKTKERISALQR
ncbi:TUDOR domain containing protein [Trichuris trichiura]|uniref:TUDOR domain containing protein n=1 Tax=Trichuris trichiura TaxID=36087 RepID=A0A077Z3Q1_TRITR|nr:TUDOR domain containing protein [Trichuris trichiura]